MYSQFTRMFVLATFVVAHLSILFLHTSCSTTSANKQPVYLIRVERGDTLSEIALKYDTSWQAIASLNNLDSASQIYVGQVLRLKPGPSGYVDQRSGQLASLPNKPATRSVDEWLASSPISTGRASNQDGLLFGGGSQMIWPAKGRVSSHYGMRRGRMHHGVDISAPTGTAIRSADSGQVIFVGRQNGYGKTVIVKHRGIETLYAHCSKILVNHGQYVEKGQIIAKMGSTGNSTGPHLHFEVRAAKGQTIDPLKLYNREQRLAGTQGERR